MNKKFFTLIAGLLMLAASLGTATAQAYTAEYSKGKATYTISPQLPGPGTVSERLYQLGVSNTSGEVYLGATYPTTSLATASHLLAVVQDQATRQFHVRAVVAAAGGYDLASTLWKIRVTKNAEGALSYTFVNVKTNQPLNFSAGAPKTVVLSGSIIAATPTTVDTASLGGEIGLWKWQPAVKPVAPFEKVDLTSAFGAALDSAVTLVTRGTLGGSDVAIGVVKYALGNKWTGANRVYLTPYDATPILLTPDDLNSGLWTRTATLNAKSTFNLSFTDDVKGSDIGNLFTSKTLTATWAVGSPANYYALPIPASPNRILYSSSAYNTQLAVLDKAKYALEYQRAKVAFGQQIAEIIAIYTEPTPQLLTPAQVRVAIGLVFADATGLTVAGALPGSEDVPGTAAYGIKNSVLRKYLTATLPTPLVTIADYTAAFQKRLVQAIVDFAEIQLVDPESETLLTTTVPPGTYPINALFSNVYEPVYNVFGPPSAVWTTQSAATALGALAEGISSRNPNYTGGLLAWSNTSVNASSGLQGTVDTQQGILNGISINNTIRNEDASWISLIVENNDVASKRTYLSVDTNFITNNNEHLGFKVQKFVDVGSIEGYYPWMGESNPARLDLNGRFNFQFHYFPTQDSIVIRVGGFAKKLATQENWGELNTHTNLDLGLDKAGVHPPTLSDIDNLYSSNNFFQDRNVVKLAYLTSGHSEVTVGSSEYAAGKDPRTTINTLIRIGKTAQSDLRTTLPSGLYFIQLKTSNSARKALDGAYKLVHISARGTEATFAKQEESQLNGTIQNFGYMPAAQWVIEQYAYGDDKTNLVSIYNREYPNIRLENVQLYKTEKGDAIEIPAASGSFLPNGDALTITQIDKKVYPEAYTNTYLGYHKETSDKYYKLDYLSGIKLGNYLKVLDSATDSLIRVDVKDDYVYFELEETEKDKGTSTNQIKDSVPEGYFGYSGYLADKDNDDYLFEHLRRTTYNIRIKAPYLLFADGKYIVRAGQTATGEELYAISSRSEKVDFFLKENNRLALESDKAPFFALVEATHTTGTPNDTLWIEGIQRAGVKDGSLLLTRERFGEQRVAAFALRESDVYLYRRFDGGQYGSLTEPYGDETNSPLYLKFYKHNNSYELLSENSKYNTNYRDDIKNKDISFLGLYNKAQTSERGDSLSYTFYVDTAYVRGGTVMPQYMLALRPDIQPEDRWIYKGEGQWFDSEGNPVTPPETENKEVYFPYLVKGDYLFNAQDSVSAGNKDYEGKFAYGAQGVTRLAFVTGVHLRDTFYVLPDGLKTRKASQLAQDTLTLYKLANKYKHNLGKNTHYLSDDTTKKSMVFQFRLIDDSNRRFLIETTKSGSTEIAPFSGRWVKIQNGVPVISDVTTIDQAVQNGAEIFDVTDEGINEKATANEAVTETTVKVISETGAVTILNAAGKSVAISNILGQTVASAVLTSDNARVALPKGIVIVAVEGESAIKAVVK
jgi:hypothetical protein